LHDEHHGFRSLDDAVRVSRRDLFKISAGVGLLLGDPTVWAPERRQSTGRPGPTFAERSKIARTPRIRFRAFSRPRGQVSDPSVIRDAAFSPIAL
jgi:hypothetical protein